MLNIENVKSFGNRIPQPTSTLSQTVESPPAGLQPDIEPVRDETPDENPSNPIDNATPPPVDDPDLFMGYHTPATGGDLSPIISPSRTGQDFEGSFFSSDLLTS